MSNLGVSLMVAFMMFSNDFGFKEKQLRQIRVQTAYRDAGVELLPELMMKTGNRPFSLFIRAFKAERVLEAWIKPEGKNQFQLFRTYPFCATSGTLGPKRQEGDLQIPEGVYSIRHFNPQSNFYLSLGIDYPNASDRVRSDPVHPGSAIYIHGGCATIGCIPITDEKIKELYVMAVEARESGQLVIPIHLFPMRWTADNKSLKTRYPEHQAFWDELKLVFDYFEREKKVPEVLIGSRGEYEVRSTGR